MEHSFYPQYRGTYIQVDLGAVAHNVRLLKEETAQDRHMLAVVKANAYGHGIVQVARVALENGADYLGVAIPEEGETLRNAGITAPVLVLGGVNEKGAFASVKMDLIQTVFDTERIYMLEKAALEQNKTAQVHLKIDSGMGRIGVRSVGEVQAILKALEKCPHVKLTGAFTHFADADGEEETYTMQQMALFDEMTSVLPKGIVFHAAASAGSARFAQARYDMVRQGIALYGCKAGKSTYKVRPALSWHTEIVYVKTIPAGACVSYGCTFEAKQETKVATLPVGYGDGYSRSLSGKAQVLVAGKRCNVLGRVCMDQIMVDVTALSDDELYIGAPVVLLGAQGEERITADEMADWAGTISYEMLMAATARVPVMYTKHEK